MSQGMQATYRKGKKIGSLGEPPEGTQPYDLDLSPERQTGKKCII